MLSSIACARLIRTLRSVDPDALEPGEAEALREAADARLFGDVDADARMEDARRVLLRPDGAPASPRLSATAPR